ncbi:trigger factor [Synechococcus sp. HJ21-Hayes]|jgi:trigger factor|uniref:trigger factor n=1 Tax=unclassified Synechococcus TaxID=2626047 RepID=UPI0020CC5CA0|nr:MULTISPECIES: trigger factor [unclassified Synechococcus]MCP9832040.1 trigger factor [Synechococcus sp. JJ3a-Johnson]MCP9852745.1 trigger factor [Synechococcus sp. HJ21-Hayes]
MSPAASPAAPTAKTGADLKVSTSPRPGSRMAVEISVPAGRTQTSHDAAVEKLSRSIKLPGFRKGKVPRAVLLQQIGPVRIRATALEDLVDSVFRDALKQAEIPAIGQPALDGGFESLLERFEPGQELNLTLEMDVEPTPSLKSTKGLKAEAVKVEFDAARVDELIDQSRRQMATLVPVDGRAAAEGDVAVIGFQGTFVDTGEAISGGSADAMEVELEDGRMIPGFVEGILGMKPGDSKTVACQFPEEYPQEDAAGRKASFEISLTELKARELPALDDAFAQQASDKQTLAELRDDLEARLKDEAERRNSSNRHDALLAALVEQLEVELPETLVQEEIMSLLEQTAGQLAQQGMDVKKLFTPQLVQSLRETSRPEAEERLKRSLALKALAASEKLELSDQEIDDKVKELSRGFSDTANIDPQRLRAAVQEDLMREKLLVWLEANSTITEKADDAKADD